MVKEERYINPGSFTICKNKEVNKNGKNKRMGCDG
jgi:hypothetical protein